MCRCTVAGAVLSMHLESFLRSICRGTEGRRRSEHVRSRNLALRSHTPPPIGAALRFFWSRPERRASYSDTAFSRSLGVSLAASVREQGKKLIHTTHAGHRHLATAGPRLRRPSPLLIAPADGPAPAGTSWHQLGHRSQSIDSNNHTLPTPATSPASLLYPPNSIAI